MMRTRCLQGPLLVIAVLAGACSAQSEVDFTVEPKLDRGNPPQTADVNEGSEALGEFTPSNCAFDVPAVADVECGTVSVPEDYSSPSGAQVTLAVAIIRSSEPRADGPPTIYLEGGPGGHALETIQYSYFDRWEPLLTLGDVIIFDQRGTGLSIPRLSCPEVDSAYDNLAGTPNPDLPLVKATILAATALCYDRLQVEGVGLEHFHTENNAHDVNQIAKALDEPKLNLFGISYGTRLALEVMRQHPEIVGNVVLDSTLSPEVDATAETQASIVASYDNIVSACAEDSACSDAFGDLDARVRDVYAQLEESPISADAENYLTGEISEVAIDGDGLMGIIIGALYSPYGFTDIPELIAELEAGEIDVLESFLALDETNSDFFTGGMLVNFACHDEVGSTTQESLAAFDSDDPLWAFVLDTSENVGSFAPEICAVWDSGDASEGQNDPVESDANVLFLAGGLDPVTPPAWADGAAESLPNSTVLHFPTLSHGVSSDICGMDLTVAFLADPANLDTSCVEDVGPPAFVLEPETELELEEFSADIDVVGTSVRSVTPVGWGFDPSQLQALRSLSITDETSTVQFGADKFTTGEIISNVAAIYEVSLGSPETEEIGGASWTHATGESGSGVVVDAWTSEQGDLTATVILISDAAERDSLVDLAAVPMLGAIEVAPL